MPVVIVEPARQQDLTARQRFDMPPPAIKAAADIKTRIAGTIRVDPDNAEGVYGVVIREVSSRDDFAIRLNFGPYHKRIGIAIDGDAQHPCEARARIEGRVEGAVRIQPRD